MTSAALSHARWAACWQLAALEIAKMTETERLLELTRIRAEEYHEQAMTDEEILMAIYPLSEARKTK